MPANFAARFDFTARRDGPMEQGIEARHALAIFERLHVFEERGKAPDDFAAVHVLSHFEKSFQRHICFDSARSPKVANDFLRRELTLERRENAPFKIIERDDGNVLHLSGRIGFAARFHTAAARVPDAERE